MSRSDVESQQLWICRWGTMAALVWAQTAENAEIRVRHKVFDRYRTIAQVEAQPRRVDGDMFVRLATAADIAEFEEAGGRVPA